MACGFQGNPDVYGIGIRIGYYTQALAIWFANYFHFDELKGLRAGNNLFIFALVVVGCIYAHEAQSIYAIEAFLLLVIGICIGFVGILESSRYTSRCTKASAERLLLRTIVVNVGLIFNVCFWWKGLDAMQPTPCPENNNNNAPHQSRALNTSTQHTYACYVVKTNLYGWMRTVMQVISISGLLWTVLVIAGSDPVELLHLVLMRRTKAAFINAATSVNLRQKNNGQGTGAGSRDLPAIKSGESSVHPFESSPLVDGNGSPCVELVDNTRSTSPVGGSQSNTGGQGLQDDNEELLVALQAVRDAEVYLDSIFSAFEEPKALLGHRRLITAWRGRIRFYVPHANTQKSPKWPSYTRTWYIALASIWIGKIPLNLRWRLLLHKIGLPKPLDWSRMLFRAYQVSEKQKPPDWKFVTIASDVQLSQVSLRKSGLQWAFLAIQQLGIIVTLIVHAELTIIWNHVEGLNSLSSLGQLIPFILGVGGLLKVLWGKFSLLRRGIKEDLDSRDQANDKYQAAINRYLEWKMGRETIDSSRDRSIPPPAGGTAETTVDEMHTQITNRRA